MTAAEHNALRELLPLAASDGLDAGWQRRIERHAAECGECRRELEEWLTVTQALVDAPLPMAPEGLVGRTQRRIAAERAARRERVVSDVIVAFVLLFGWTISLMVWLGWKILVGEPLLGVDIRQAAYWLAGTTAFAWVTAGVAAILLAPKMHVTRRML